MNSGLGEYGVLAVIILLLVVMGMFLDGTFHLLDLRPTLDADC